MTELEELKRLLFGEEKRSLSELEARVENPTTRAQDVASVLAESISLGAAQDERLAGALRKPVNDCIRQSIQQDTEVFADALFPVMGPAIRKSVMETFKTLMQRLNETVETAFSWRGLKWRIESVRTGVPVTEIALRDTLEYRVDQLFLIHRPSGLLMRHAARADLVDNDSDAVSAMLTAIQDFVRDSFGAGTVSDLDTVDIGEHTVWLLNGPAAILAVVFRGIPPLGLRTRFSTLLEDFHAEHAATFQSFDGDSGRFAELDERLGEQLRLESRAVAAPAPASRSWFGLTPALAAVLGILILVIALPFAWSVSADRKLARFVEALRAEPGIAVTRAAREDGGVVIEGLADPLAAARASLAEAAGYDSADITWRLAPYQAMDPPIVAARARQLLRPPAGVTLDYDGSVLRLSGHASGAWLASLRQAPLGLLGVSDVDTRDLLSVEALAARFLAAPPTVELHWDEGVLSARGVAGVDWLENAAARATQIEGVDAFDASGARIDPASIVARWRGLLNPPADVHFELVGERLRLSGTAPAAWIESVRRAVHAPVYIDGLDTSGLVPAERDELEALASELDGQAFAFVSGTEFEPGTVGAIEMAASRLRRVRELDLADAARTVEITVMGFTDASGSPALNAPLRAARATAVSSRLKTALGEGVAITARAATDAEHDLPRTQRRAAVLKLRIRETQSP